MCVVECKTRAPHERNVTVEQIKLNEKEKNKNENESQNGNHQLIRGKVNNIHSHTQNNIQFSLSACKQLQSNIKCEV